MDGLRENFHKLQGVSISFGTAAKMPKNRAGMRSNAIGAVGRLISPRDAVEAQNAIEQKSWFQRFSLPLPMFYYFYLLTYCI
jgi:hypothetical protein